MRTETGSRVSLLPPAFTTSDLARAPHALRIPARALRLEDQFSLVLFLGIFPACVLLLWGYLFTTDVMQDLVLDTALSIGLGEPLPDTVLDPGACNRYEIKGKGAWSGWLCPIAIETGTGPATDHVVEVSVRETAAEFRGAGTLLGYPGLYWPLPALMERWWQTFPFFAITAPLLFWTLLTLLRRIKLSRRLSRIRKYGVIRPVEILTFSGQARFSFTDDRQHRIFAHGTSRNPPLLLDGPALYGAALVDGRDALLIDYQLYPFDLSAETRSRLMAEVQAWRLKREEGRPVSRSPASAPELQLSEISALEQSARNCRSLEHFRHIYVQAWSLVWNARDPEVTRRAFLLRDRITGKLAMPVVLEFLQFCRNTVGLPRNGNVPTT